MSDEDDRKKPVKDPSSPQPVSDRILNSLKPRTGKTTNKWMIELAEGSAKSAGQSAAVEPIPPSQVPAWVSEGDFLVSLLDQLFDFFQQIEFDFNKSVAGTDYKVTVERPSFASETIRRSSQSQEAMRVFSGRVVTRYWTLLLRVQEQVIQGWVLPAERLFGFRADDNSYSPFVEISQSDKHSDGSTLRVNTCEIATSETRSLARELFASLIRIAKGEAVQSQPFALAQGEAGGSLPVLPNSPMRAVANEPAGQFASKAVPAETGGGDMIKGEATPLQTLEDFTESTSTISGTKEKAPLAASLQHVVATLKTVTDNELETLASRGAQAFSNQDIQLVQKILKRTESVKALRSEMAAALERWQALLLTGWE